MLGSQVFPLQLSVVEVWSMLGGLLFFNEAHDSKLTNLVSNISPYYSVLVINVLVVVAYSLLWRMSMTPLAFFWPSLVTNI